MMSISESNVNHPSVVDAMQSCEKNSSSKGDSAHSMRFLPDGFAPGEHDVLCGRGRKCFNHPGNVKFREIVHNFLPQYSKAMTKLEKSYILSDVVEKVRQNSGIGGFIKKNEDGRWFEVGDFLAREKTSQAFRDVLHDKYKSSNTSKKKRRQEEQAEKLFCGHSNRSLDCGSVHTAGSTADCDYSTGHDSQKLMRIERPDLVGFTVEESQDDLLGALDMQLASSFGGRKGLASQRSLRSVMEVDRRQVMMKQANQSVYTGHSCPNLFKPRHLKPQLSSSMDHPPIPTQVVLEDSVMEPNLFDPMMDEFSMDRPVPSMDTIDGSFSSAGSRGSRGMDFNMGMHPSQQVHPGQPTRSEWMHHSQPNLYNNAQPHNVSSRRRQFARMPPHRQNSLQNVMSRQGSAGALMSRQGSSGALMSRQGSSGALMSRQGSAQSIMSRQGSAHNVMARQSSSRSMGRQNSLKDIMARQNSAKNVILGPPGSHLLNGSQHSHSHLLPMNNMSSTSTHSRHSMTVFEEQLDNLALSDHCPPAPPPPSRAEPEYIDINDLVLSPMAGETKDSLLASLASLSDSFAIEPIAENPFDAEHLR